MNFIKKYFPITIRVVIAVLFLVSAVAKLYPSPYFAISTFEVKQLYTLGFSESVAPFFSRILIGIEFALGFLVLHNHFLKRITIPATLLMLAVFTVHLTIITFVSGGSSGNCGCFGSLLPMTPIEAIAKNVVAILLLSLYLWLTRTQPDPKSNFWILTTVGFASILAVFIVTFSQPKQQEQQFTVTDLSDIKPETVPQKIAIATEILTAKTVSETTKIDSKIMVGPIVTVTKSGYEKYFSNINQGQKILCFFVPGCPHCVKVANELTNLKNKNKNFPEIQILFMDEEADRIPEFFDIAGAKYSYKIIDIIGFWKILGTGKDVPGVKLLRDGKTVKYYFGTTENEFKSDDLLSLLK